MLRMHMVFYTHVAAINLSACAHDIRWGGEGVTHKIGIGAGGDRAVRRYPAVHWRGRARAWHKLEAAVTLVCMVERHLAFAQHRLSLSRAGTSAFPRKLGAHVPTVALWHKGSCVLECRG